MLSEAADNSALEACPDSVQFPGSIRWGAAHFFEPIISLRPCLRGELRSMPRDNVPFGRCLVRGGFLRINVTLARQITPIPGDSTTDGGSCRFNELETDKA